MTVLWSTLGGGTRVGGRGRIWEQVSQLHAKGCRAVGGPGLEGSFREEEGRGCCGDWQVTGTHRGTGQPAKAEGQKGSCPLSPTLTAQKPVAGENGCQLPRSLAPKLRYGVIEGWWD